jgi:hypothetical protein
MRLDTEYVKIILLYLKGKISDEINYKLQKNNKDLVLNTVVPLEKYSIFDSDSVYSLAGIGGINK